MPAIGYVAKAENGSFKSRPKTFGIRAEITILPNDLSANDLRPDFRVVVGDVEIGAGWRRRCETSGKDYISLSFDAPEFGPRRLYADLDRVIGTEDDDRFAIIWIPED